MCAIICLFVPWDPESSNGLHLVLVEDRVPVPPQQKHAGKGEVSSICASMLEGYAPNMWS